MSIHRRRPPAAALGAALAVLGVQVMGVRAARADTAPAYADLLRQAEATAPRLAEGRAGVRQAEGQARQAAVLPNPTLGVTVENLGGGARLAAIAPQQTTVQVQQPLELGGKRAARTAAGAAGLDLARVRDLQARADFAFDLAGAYVDAEADDVRLDLADEALAMAVDDARAVEALVEAGKEANVRAVQARAAVEAARAGRVQAQTARDAALAKLTALAGSPAPFTALAGGLLAHGEVLEQVHAVDPLSAPAYLTARAERDLAARRERVEETRAAPDLSATLGLRQLQGVSGGALVAGLSMPLPLFDRNRGAVSAARGELAAADARLNAARFQAEADARTGQARLQASEGRLQAAKAMDAAAAEAYRLTRLGYEAGKVGLLELQSARRALTEARTQTLETRIDRLLAEASLARLQGAVPFGDKP
jgi:cobalt-zinc-cadmium efflux system outer membrane protein